MPVTMPMTGAGGRPVRSERGAALLALVRGDRRRAALAALGACDGDAGTGEGGPQPPPQGAAWDLQLGGDYPPGDGVTVVERDWFTGEPLPGGYSLCYVNAFQTQADEGTPPGEAGARPDLTSQWPPDLVLRDLEDPGWPGEFLVDISTSEKRQAAADHVAPMLESCAADGFDAVELDNLDSWTRFDGTDREGDVPFGQDEGVAYALLLVEVAHENGLAAAQKNAADLADVGRADIGFDLAVVEECGAYDECAAYTEAYGDSVLVVEYTDEGFESACAELRGRVPVVLRDVDLSVPGAPGHVVRRC